MSKTVILCGLILFALAKPCVISAQQDWQINSFDSTATLEENTDLNITEIIEVDFDTQKHGIFRTIPYVYSANGQTIRAELEFTGVTDPNGNDYKHAISKDGKNTTIKIGDPDLTIIGENTYVIKYKIRDVVLRLPDHDEIYWNVLGTGWDVPIVQSSFRLESDYANIEDVVCYTGILGSRETSCEVKKDDSNVSAVSISTLGEGKDLTVVVALNPVNSLLFPTQSEVAAKKIIDNWGYILAFLPLVAMSIFWFRKGRDARYTDDNIYKTDSVQGRKEKVASLFEHKFLPMVYRPIDNLTPAEVGVITDDRIDLPDIVAEIIELARLGFIQVEKFDLKKRLSKDETEYAFIKTDKYNDTSKRSDLRDYQDYLLRELFRSTAVHKSVTKAEKIFDGKSSQLEKTWKLLAKHEYVFLSGLVNHFYEALPIIKEKVYKRVSEQGYFDGNPDKVRIKWITLGVLMDAVGIAMCFVFLSATGNFGPVILGALLTVPTVALGFVMPRRSAKGYSYKRQIEGFKWYLGKGKWRHEISEKKLFLEDVLPYAIALGVVDKLSKDMQDLTITPPTYLGGMTTASFTRDFGGFNRTLSSTVVSAPKSSGSTWSGGSGFSGGGSSGGGFGGGGGGSW